MFSKVKEYVKEKLAEREAEKKVKKALEEAEVRRRTEELKRKVGDTVSEEDIERYVRKSLKAEKRGGKVQRVVKGVNRALKNIETSRSKAKGNTVSFSLNTGFAGKSNLSGFRLSSGVSFGGFRLSSKVGFGGFSSGISLGGGFSGKKKGKRKK